MYLTLNLAHGWMWICGVEKILKLIWKRNFIKKILFFYLLKILLKLFEILLNFYKNFEVKKKQKKTKYLNTYFKKFVDFKFSSNFLSENFNKIIKFP